MAETSAWHKDVMFNEKGGAAHPPLYPNEYLVKCFSSNSYSFVNRSINQTSDGTGKSLRLLEVGFFSGNNLRFFLDEGYEVYGCEISKDIGDVGVQNLNQSGYSNFVADVGENTKLPYASDFFDVVVSINTIHYSSGGAFRDALIEWRRVLKQGGLLYVETVGPKHFVREASERKSTLDWIWGYDDFRKGQRFGFVDSELHLKEELHAQFTLVETGSRLEKYPYQTLEFLIGMARK